MKYEQLTDEAKQVIGKTAVHQATSLAHQYINVAEGSASQPAIVVMAGILAAVSCGHGMISTGKADARTVNLMIRETLTHSLERAGIPMTGILGPRAEMAYPPSTNLRQLLTDVAATLIDLGACNDADCPDCAHVLTRVQAALAEMTAPAHG